jgi:hypothetical protein
MREMGACAFAPSRMCDVARQRRDQHANTRAGLPRKRPGGGDDWPAQDLTERGKPGHGGKGRLSTFTSSSAIYTASVVRTLVL